MENDHLCRICLENGAKYPLFENTESEDCILNKLYLCLKEKVEDIEGYPRFICINCYDTIDTVCSFINKYKETSDFLSKSVTVLKAENNLNPKVEVEVDIYNIKTEPESDDATTVLSESINTESWNTESMNTSNDSDNPDESLPLIQLKLKSNQKRETDTKTAENKEKKLTIKSQSTETDINRIASSILEGEFAWIGDVWCIKPTKSRSGNTKEQKVNKDAVKRSKSTRGRPEEKSSKQKTKAPDLKFIWPKPQKSTSPPPPRLCDLCGEIFKDQDKLSIHKKKVHFKQPTKCPHCPRMLVSKYYLTRHLKRRHDTQGKNFMCQTCGRAFAFKGELSTHITNVHNKHLKPKKVYTCKICNKNYKCAKSVLVHERSVHTGLRPAVCEICGTSFFHEDYLREHMRLHTGETPFKCPICGRGYAQRCNMKSHLRIHRISDLDATTLSKLRPSYLKLLKVA